MNESTSPAEGARLATWQDTVAIIVALLLPSAITWVYFFKAESLPAGSQIAIFNVVKIVQFAFPLVWVMAVQRQRIALRPTSAKGIGAGISFGVVVAAAMFALYFAVLRDSSLLLAAK